MASDLMNPAQCNICETAAAKFNCNTCGDALCATCKVHHLKSKGSKHHKVVPYAEKLNPKYLAALLCPKHQTHGPKFWCDTCGVPICDSCIVSNAHKGHEYSDITATLSERRDDMLTEMKTLRDQTVVEWEEVLKQAKRMTPEFQGNIDDIDKELVARAKEMHREVDKILESSQKTLQQIKTTGLAKLRRQEKYLEDKLHQLKEDVERYENQLRDADPNTLLQFKQDPHQGKDKTKPPVLETPLPPLFTKGQIDTDAMKNMFGQLSTQIIPQKSGEDAKKSNDSSHPSQQLPNSSTTGKTKVLELSSGVHSAGSGTKRSLIPNPSVQHKFDVGYYNPRIACVEQGLAWVKTGVTLNPRSTTIKLVDRDGSVRDAMIKIYFFFDDMAVTSDGDLLLTDEKSSCIKSVSRQKIMRTLFTTSGKPFGLCCLPNNDIVTVERFGFDTKVIIYSRTGQIRHTFDNIKCRSPFSVSVNKINQDIYICDKENSDFCDSAGKVIAVGADGKLRYEYTGQSDSKFTPAKMCTDQIGHVLITDYSNHLVHILDQEGQFIQYILTSQHGLKKPLTIDVDKEGYVWVGQKSGFSKGQVRVARYLQ